MTDTVCRNPTFLAIRHAVPSWSLSMSPISRNAPRASRQHPQKQDRPGGRGDTIAFPVAALLEWLAAPVKQAVPLRRLSPRHGGFNFRRPTVAQSASVKVFGRRPPRTFPHAPRPASENLQGTKPREGARVGRCRGRSYGDLAMDGQRPRSAARSGERLRWRCSSDARHFSELRAGVWRKIGVVNAALEGAALWPAEERADRRVAFSGWRL
jgi:hypothetical protein